MLIKEIRLQNLLSFGPDTPPLELRPLNVLIGPNGSGKSNLIEAISLLQAAPKDLTEPVLRGGGGLEWIWKGAPSEKAVVTTTVMHPDVTEYKHTIQLKSTRSGMIAVIAESLVDSSEDNEADVLLFESHFEDAKALVEGKWIEFRLESDEWHRSILALRRDPLKYRAITYLARRYEQIRVFSGWDTGRTSPLRVPQNSADAGEFLRNDLSNFALTVSGLLREPAVKARLLKYLQKLGSTVRDIGVDNLHGTVQVYIHDGDFRIPAIRMSDGTLRYLCLLSVLCHPHPPEFLCIEEPELGLHPDMMPTIAELLRDAATRTQLIVTTHSDVLIDALSDTPEDVVVCEKHDGCTTMKRLVKEDLAIWLEKYSLGDLWNSGQIGGNRF